jgi:hypothetical protein
VFRDVTPLFPGAELACGGTPSPLPPAGQLDPGVPADASRAPEFASATPSGCAIAGCGMRAEKRTLTGYCPAHQDAWLATVREYTDDIGRGEFS